MGAVYELGVQALQGRQVAARAQKQKKAQRKRIRQPEAEHSGGDEAAHTEASQEPSKDRQQRPSTSGKPIGWSFLPREDERWQPDEEPATASPQVCWTAGSASSCACGHICTSKASRGARVASRVCMSCRLPAQPENRLGLEECNQEGVKRACVF